MTNILFGQWRDDKLPNGDYYIKVRGNLTGKEFFARDNCINGKLAYTLDGNVIDVIAPVPSYDKYIELVSKTEQLEKNLEVSEKAHHKTLEKLRIATKALRKYTEVETDDWIDSKEVARKALKEIEGVK